MTNKFLNILIVESEDRNADLLTSSILGNGNNPLRVKTLEQGIELLNKKPIGLVLINLEQFSEKVKQFVHQINSTFHFKSPWLIGYVSDEASVHSSYFNLNLTDVWLTGSFRFIREKIENWKTIYFEKTRISDFLIHLYPDNIISNFYRNEYSNPVKKDHAVIMFMDFVEFSFKSKNLTPTRVAKKLTKYFNRFDEIVKRYHLEKIKTIGDAYMVIGGVTESNPNPDLRMCLAAIEIRQYMVTQKLVSQAFNRDYWEIRIGIHSGPLVSGIIGKTKFHFDVWGDSVNIAARTEKASRPNSILISEKTEGFVREFFMMSKEKSIQIAKRGGQMQLFELKDIKKQFDKKDLLEISDVERIDFKRARNFIIHQLKALLPDNCPYHSLSHTLDVEKAAIRFAKIEGLSIHERILVRTAALLHDLGFISQYDHNEKLAVQFSYLHLPDFGYSDGDIKIIEKCILATEFDGRPLELIEKIVCDADLDYLGREDYFDLVELLRIEFSLHGKNFSDLEWIQFQLNYLENHHKYHTQSAIQIRGYYKQKRILELKKKLSLLA